MNGTKVEFCEYVLRTIRTRNGWRWGYWWARIANDTWGKQSKKNGDYGWLPNAWIGWRTKYAIDDGRPYAATKLGAVRNEIAIARGNIEAYGKDYDLDEDGATLGQQLTALRRLQTRLRNSESNNQ